MSLDSLYQQIILTEQQLSDQAKTFQEVKVAIIRCNEKIKVSTEKYEKANEELDKKAQQLSVLRLQHDLTKKCEDQMLKQAEELLCQRSHLRDHLEKIKSKSKEEQENFLQEISRFNGEFSLRGSRETMSESQTHRDILDLEKKAQMLCKDMELMSQKNSYVKPMLEEKRTLQLQLQGLENISKGLDLRLKEAESMSESLRAESLSVSQKPRTDATCLRLREELELHKDAELQLARDALASEMHFLLSKLDSSQAEQQR